MLDLVAQEEIISRIGGMPFDDLLQVVDQESSADLRDLYAQQTDRYMILAGRGKRTRDEDVELDRLDSALRMILGEEGMLALSARLVRVIDAARTGAVVFLTRERKEAAMVKAPLSLSAAAAICRHSFYKSLIPIDGLRLAGLARRASSSASALLDIDTDRSLIDRLFGSKRISNRSVSRLLAALSTKDANLHSYMQAMHLLDPDQVSPRKRHQLVVTSFRLSGLLSCVAILAEAGPAFQKVAGLVREGLGA